MKNTKTTKLGISKGDNVEIVNKSHVGYGEEGLILIGITKHRHKNIYLYEVENDNSRFYCENCDLKKV